MYDIFESEFDVSETTLKEKIYFYSKKLQFYEPDKWSDDFVASIHPSKSTSEIIEVLKNTPLVVKINSLFEKWDPKTILQNIARSMSIQVEAFDLKDLYLKHFFKKYRHHFLIFRYMLVTEILFEKYGKTPITKNPRLIVKTIVFGYEKDPIVTLSNFAEEEALREIQAFYNDETNKEYVEKISKIEQTIYEYIHKHAYKFCSESFKTVDFEAFSKNTDLINQTFDFEDKITQKVKRDEINKWWKKSLLSAKERMDVRDLRGGKRERKTFKWTDANKVSLYQTVNELPKINGKPMWEYAYQELMEKDFNHKIIDYLKIETAFRSVPKTLFGEAVRTWRKYKDRFEKPKPFEKPYAFALLHALHLLAFPEAKFSTLKKYYGEGKKLFEYKELN